MAEKILSESPPAGVTDRTWGVLTAFSESAKRRSQGQHMFLTLPEHTLGRAVKESGFLFDSPSISGRHCTIFRRTTENAVAAYIKDSSSNGTYVNGQRLRKDSPELRLQHGDVISLAALPELALVENGFAYVYLDTSSGLKRKPEIELSKSEDAKRMKTTGVAGDGNPVNLADVRRLERSNQELRQKLELECNKSDALNADLRAANSSTEARVKEAVDQCNSVYTERLADLQAKLSTNTTAMEEFSAKCVQQESVIEDLNNRLKAAAKSRVEAEEALNNFKANREELEKQLEDERNQWKKDRQDLESQHKSTVDRIRAEAAEDSTRQAEGFSRQLKQLEDKISVMQYTMTECRVQIESQRKQLEEEREVRLNFERECQEVHIQLNSEQHVSATLKQELEKRKNDLRESLDDLDAYKEQKNALTSKVAALQLEKEELVNKLKRESQRFEGARDRILLRETQLRAFQSTAEEISTLQQKQQAQLQAMMQTLKDDDAEYANVACNYNDADEPSESKTIDEEMKDVEVTTRPEVSVSTRVNASQDRSYLGNATLDLNEMAEDSSGFKEENNNAYAETQPQEDAAPTQLNVTQLDGTQLLPHDFYQGREQASNAIRADDAVMETQVVAEVPATPLLERSDADNAGDDRNDGNRGDVPQTPILERQEREQLQSDSRRQSQNRRGSLCTADLFTSEVLGSEDNNSQEEQERRDFASQVGNSDSMQARGLEMDDAAAGPRIGTLSSQNCPKVLDKNTEEAKNEDLEVVPDAQGGAEDTEEEFVADSDNDN